MLAVEASGLVPARHSVRIVSAFRSWEEQDRLYAQGRTAPGRIVTSARGGQSTHNFGIAWDVGVFDGAGRYLQESEVYRAIGPVGEEIGLEWGGRWRSFPDYPHYNVRTGLTVAQMRALVRAGKTVPVPPYGGSAIPRPGNAVEVWDGNRRTNVPAYLDQGRVWVAVRPYMNEFGGVVLSAEGGTFVVGLRDNVVSVPGVVRDGVGYARFGDLNRATEWDFRYEAGRLTIIREVN
jgi:hypothetical protein